VRLYEFENIKDNIPENNLLTALELIRHRYKDKETSPKINTQSLINLVINTDRTFNYDALVAANEENPAIKNIIKSFNKDYVELQPIGLGGDEDDAGGTITNTSSGDATTAPVDTVSDMANSAAKKRGAAGF